MLLLQVPEKSIRLELKKLPRSDAYQKSMALVNKGQHEQAFGYIWGYLK
jgi:hypothetical protein